MPQARDRILGELAVEQGLLTRDDAERYYSLLDSAPGTPPLSQLLLRDRRATAEDLVRLRDIWQDRQARGAGAPAAPAVAAAPAPLRAPAPLPSSGHYPRLAPPLPMPTAPPQPAPGFAPTASSGQRPPLPPGAPDPEALKRDEVLARVLVSRRVLTQEQAREARALQVKHGLRFAAVVVRKNFTDRSQVEDALQYLRERVVLCLSCGAAHERARLGPARTCPRCNGALAPAVVDDATPLVPTSVPPRMPAPAPSPPPVGPGGEDPEAVTIRGAITSLPRSLDPFASVRDNRAPGPSGSPTAAFPPSRGPMTPAPAFGGGFAPPPAPFGGPGRPMGMDDSRAVLASRGGPATPSPWAPGPGKPPPPIRIDTSADELEVFVPHGDLKPREVSVDELNPFSPSPAPPGFAAGGPFPSASPAPAPFPSATPFAAPAPFPSAEPFPSSPPSGGGFGAGPGAAPAAAPIQSGYGMAAPIPPPVGGPDLGGFGSSPESRPGTVVEEPAADDSGAGPGAGLDVGEGEPAADDAAPPEGGDSPEADAGPNATRVDRSRRGGKAPVVPQRKSSLGLVLGILVGILVVGGLLTGLALFLSKKARIDKNLQTGDESFDKKDWDKALSSYKLVLDDDHDNAQATKRKGECEQKLEELALEAEAKVRIGKSRVAGTADEALRVLTEDSAEKKLSEDQKAKLAARVDVLVATAHAHARLADDFARRERPGDVVRELDEAKKALDTAAATSPTPIVEVSLEKVRLLERQRGHGPEITTLLGDIANADPEGWAGAYARGRLALEGKSPKLEEALSQLETSVSKQDQKQLPEAVFFRGKAKLAASRPAREDFTAALGDLPDDPRPAIELAKISLDKDNDPARSSGYVQQAVARGVPDDPEILALQGEVAVLQQQYAPALPKLDRALKADPSLVRARKARAHAWVEVNKDKPPTPEFEADLEAAIPKFPDDVQLRLYRALAKTIKQDWPSVIADYDAYLKAKDDDDVRLRRARALRNAGKLDDAIADCEWLLARNKNNGNAIAERALCQLKKEDFASAVEGFTTVIGVATGQAQQLARFFRGLAYIGCKKYKLAQDDFEAYIKDQPNGPDADKARHYIEQCKTALEKGGGS